MLRQASIETVVILSWRFRLIILSASKGPSPVLRKVDGALRAILLLAVVLLSACTPAMRQYDLKEQPMPCDEANRVSHDTLTSLGYEVTAFETATPGKRGQLRARHKVHAGNQSPRSVTVVIECSAAGATIEASEDGKILNQIDFKRAFQMTFTSVRTESRKSAEFDEKVSAGTAPKGFQRGDVQVRLVPVVGQSAKLDFNLDMAAAGVLPVQVRVQNLTERSYTIDPDGIRLSRADGERVSPLSLDEVAAKFTAARTADGVPLTTLSRGELIDRLRPKLFVAKESGPKSDAKGYLFYPLGTYKRGRVVLTEKDSEETEGFVVEF